MVPGGQHDKNKREKWWSPFCSYLSQLTLIDDRGYWIAVTGKW